MEDMQLNISVPKKGKPKSEVSSKKSEYKFLSNPKFVGKTIARKKSNKPLGKNLPEKSIIEPVNEPFTKTLNLATNLRDLSENKGKYFGKSYQELSDDIQSKSKPRSGGWISSLFKNNPDVPRIGQRAVKPIVEKVFSGKTFSDLNIHPHSVSNLQQNLGLKELTTVQQHAIPVILQGRDVLIRSQTGSGKTLAYALPIIEALQEIRPKINRHDGIRVVVVVPTRELAVQTYELLIKLVKPFTWVVPGLLSGGQKRKAEKARLRKGLNILVGTPGRINDHLRHTKSINFAKTGCLVLDEADRLLDMGYEQDVAAIVKAIESHKQAATYDPMALVKSTMKKTFDEQGDEEKQEPTNETNYKHNVTEVFSSEARQTILLSATLTKAVENLAGIAMVDPVFVDTSEGRAVIADSLQTNQFSKLREKEDRELAKEAKEDEEEHNKSNVELQINQNNVKKKDVDDKSESKQGLKAFRGLSSLDSVTENVASKNKQKQKTSESDSDSDYEYFKVEKELQEKKTLVENTEEIKPTDVSSTFDNAIKSAIGEDELVLPATVNQTFLIVPMKLRLVTLCSLIVEHCVLYKKGGKMIVFMATLEMVDYHADLLEAVLTGKEGNTKKSVNKKKEGAKKKRKANDGNKDESQSSSDSEFAVDYEVPAEGGLAPVEVDIFRLHGSMPHEQRMEVFKQFRTARNGVLICTDVAARGLDVARVDLVLQYCVPASATDYVHRVGRTGRAAQVGAAVLFLLPSETEFVRHLEQKRIRLRQTDESKCLESLRVVAPTAGSAGRAAIAVQTRAEYVVHGGSEWRARAARAYTSWVRFYSGYPRDVRQYLDARELHLGHAAKAFALRDTPAALGRRAKQDPQFKKDKPVNRLTVEQTKRPGFPRAKVETFPKRVVNKQSSMHTASEFDSGFTSTYQPPQKKKKT